ncbi:SdpI family protein [Clostridium ljungdahlii]|uniref:SdpI/YhfL protein family protein n=1 Tax=Clostridium ljungdahlii TaxID=1538 RepID=A0A162L6J4_9CLOT|nr:SdpI family protein [Clostridium ljungdahlii]OAA89306.1 hypothetical protein WY13_01679 [Clostridium ljungdahlii]
MSIQNYLVGMSVLIIGIIFKLWPPEHINGIMGYRTPFSMKNNDTWDEGNRFSSIIMIYAGIASLIIGAICSFVYKNNIYTALSVSSRISVILLLASIPLTEIHLRKLFDKNGVKRI